jgi:hypothetical protein
MSGKGKGKGKGKGNPVGKKAAAAAPEAAPIESKGTIAIPPAGKKAAVAAPAENPPVCNASFIEIKDLPIFELTNTIQVRGGSQGASVLDESEMLNSCVKYLQEQIKGTSSLEPTGTIDFPSQNILPLKQQNIFCFKKSATEIKTYDGTVRAQGLFEINTDSRVDPSNKLRGADEQQKFAIQKDEGNPNGVLAISLYQIVNYLNEQSNLKTSKKRGAAETKSPIEEITNILSIYEASRGLSQSEKTFVDELVGRFFEKINASSNIYEKLEWISKVYCPLINKGLSDISQAGELAKVYVLKYINAVNTGKITLDSPDVLNRQTFWDVTEGLPCLAAFSSDGIASALGVRIQNLFRGQFQSIIPRKYGKGRFSVVYIPYKYVALMMLLGNTTRPTDQQEQVIWDTIGQSKRNLTANIAAVVARYPSLHDIRTVNFFELDFLYRIRELVDNIYKYYKLFVIPQTEFFSKSIIKIIDEDILGNLDKLNKDMRDRLLKIADIFYNTSTKVSLYLRENYLEDSADTVIRRCFNFIKDVLESFGSFIKELSQIVNNNEAILTGMIRTEMIRTEPRRNGNNLKSIPAWTGIIYSTLSYYENCFYFKTLSTVSLLEKYLNLSKTEELCAEQDVDYGHDQTASSIQQLGDKAAEMFNKKTSEDNLRPRISKENHISETFFSKNLIDTLEYCSVAQTYDIYGNPTLEINFTKKPDSDFIFNTTRSGGQTVQFINNIKAIGNAEIWGSIDYTVGDPFINITKKGVSENYVDYEEFMQYFLSENIIEIRTPATNFDAAAPSGCVFKDIGRMSVSYRRFRPYNRPDINEYMYVILTIDINKNETINGIDFDLLQCQVAASPKNIFLDESEVLTILKEECKIQRKNITLELMRMFSQPFTRLTTTQADKLKGSVMLSLIKRCYNNPESGLRTMINDNFRDVNDIFLAVQDINTKLSQKGKQKTITEAQARDQSIQHFNNLISEIKDYYYECLRKDTVQERNNCESLLRSFLLLLFDCMDLGTLNSTLQSYEKENKSESKESLDKLLSAYEEERLDAIELGTAAGILHNLKADKTPEANDNRKRMALDATQVDNGLNILASVASAVPNTDARGITPQYSDEPHGEESQLEDWEEEVRSSSASAKDQVIDILKGNFFPVNPGTKDFGSLYDDAVHYYYGRPKNPIWINLLPIDQQAEKVAKYIYQVHNIRYKGKDEKVGREDSRFSRFNVPRGGKRITKKHNMYKNKVNTKRKMNKRVRKTKKRHMKRKRFTRRG